jgi:hypothetical protein
VLRLPSTVTAQQIGVGLATVTISKTHRPLRSGENRHTTSLHRCLNLTDKTRRTKESEQRDKAGDHLFEVKLMSVGEKDNNVSW